MDMNIAYIKIAAYIGAAFVMGIGTIGPAIGQGKIAAKACENIGKFPESAANIRTTMLLGMGIVETSAIYAFIIALFLLFK
jgi:F-type H+-transporting ATPase subunit c